jgi:hypothetical protein
MKIADFIDPVELERWSILFSPDNVKVRGLPSSFFQMRFPLEPTHSRARVRALSVKPLTSNTDKIVSTLLWHACFGKKFKAIHWYILFNVLIRTIKKDRNSEALLALLSILTANAAATKWDTNMKPLKSILLSKLGQTEHLKILESILNDLPFKLATKGADIDSVISFENSLIELRKPRELARIGVGYKDKGSLNTKVKPDLPSSDVIVSEKEDCFEFLLNKVKRDHNRLLKA